MAAIEAEQIRRNFDEIEAVAGVDLVVEQGEIYGFLGPNGAGKSTLVRMLCTLLLPTGGSASVLGHDIASEAEAIRLKIGVALQDVSLDERQTGREILRLQARMYGLTKAEARTRIDELSDLIDFDAIDRRIGTYSGGMRRRLDLAASLIHNPQLLFLDEPTTGLDPVARVRVWEEVRRINKELGTTIFLTTQYLEEADELANRVGIINAGKIVAEGTPEALKRSIGSDLIIATIEGDLETARAAVANMAGIETAEVHGNELSVAVLDGSAAISAVAVALNDCGVTVSELTLRTPTLDDVFLELTGERIEVAT